MTQNEVAEKRVALKPSTFNQIRAFAQGFDGTQDDAIAYLLSLAVKSGESEYEAGQRHQRAESLKATPESEALAPDTLLANGNREATALLEAS